MEENKPDSRVFLAIFLMIAFYFVWSYFFTPPPKKPTPPETQAQSAPTVVASPLPPEVEFPMEGETFSAVISSHGGAIKSWKILDEQYATEEGYLDLIPEVPQGMKQPWPGHISFETASFPVSGDVFSYEKVRNDGDADGSLRLRWTSSDKSVSLDKYFVLNEDKDGLDLDITLKNLKTAQDAAPQSISARMALHVDGYQDPNNMEGEGFWIFRAPADLSNPGCYVNGGLKHLYFAKETLTETHSGLISWVGINRTYYLKTFFPKGENAEAYTCTISTQDNGQLRSSLYYPPKTLGPGEQVTHSLGVYFGVKKTEHTNTKMTNETTSANLEGATDYGSWFGWIVGPLARGMLWLLKIFYEWVGNWGVAIIMLTIVVRIVTFWPSQRSFKSMQGLAALQPQLAQLKEKYKDDQAAYAQAQMALMRSSGVNPLGGCLPLLLQLPFFWGLYSMIYNAAEIYRAPLGLWIDNLAVADPYFILPLLTGVILWVNQRMTPTTMDAAQARMMNWLMPIMMTLFMLFLPAGLVVYTITSMLFGIGQQYYLKKMYPPKPVTAAVNPGDDKAPLKAEEIIPSTSKPRTEGSPTRPGKKNKRR